MPPIKIVISVYALLAVMAGCRFSNHEMRYDVSGTVSYAGIRVRHGVISFTPDSTNGNIGAGVSVDIVNGHYETARGHGTIGGLHKVIISGYEGTAEKSTTNPWGKVLFRDYVVLIDLPRQAATYDFTVPLLED